MIAVSSSGKSFRALANYLAAGRTGEERDRVAWSVARNLPTNDPELAATFMRATAAQSAKVEKPVYHVVLSFDPADMPDRATMERVAARVLDRLGLAEHQAVIVAHRDRTHSHVHLLVNRVHPEYGRAWERWKDQPVIQQVLREEEAALGLRPVQGSLTLNIEPIPSQSPVSQDPDRQPEASRPRTQGPDAAVNEVIEAISKYERVGELTQELQATRQSLDAAQARLTKLEIAHVRAQSASDHFQQLLTSVYRDPNSARGSFTKFAHDVGTGEAIRQMADHPERFGALITTERRIFGLRAAESVEEARRNAPAAARAGQEALSTETQMWIAASEARVRRLDETFSDRLRSVFIDEKSAGKSFLEMLTRDGIETATAELRNSPTRFGEIRPTVSADPESRTRLLSHAAGAGVDVVRARNELDNARLGLVKSEKGARHDLATLELRAGKDHAAMLVERERSTRDALGRLPRRSDLEQRIGQAADRLLPSELRKLKNMITAPRLALLAKIRSTVRDALLARDERSA